MIGPTTRPSVLVIDDELGSRESLRLVLEPRFWVMVAESGEQALDLLRNERFDVVTLDLPMPGIDGIETFKKIRETHSDVEVIVVSAAKDSVDDLAHILSRHALAWVPKPFDTAQLVYAVEQAAERCRSSRLTREKQHEEARLFSQDIKNRLNGVLGFVRLLREGQLDRRHAAQALDVIEGNAHEAAALTLNFLHAEESDGRTLELHKTPASLNRIVEDVIEDETPRARLRGIELRAELAFDLPPVCLDVAMMSHALTNLLNNALHYSPEGGLVRVETCRFADALLLRVRDHGDGIPAEEIPELFERRGRGAKSGGNRSTGLGLHLVRTIVEAHGGSVSVTLPRDGGLAFVIAFPCPPRENA